MMGMKDTKRGGSYGRREGGINGGMGVSRDNGNDVFKEICRDI